MEKKKIFLNFIHTPPNFQCDLGNTKVKTSLLFVQKFQIKLRTKTHQQKGVAELSV
jgi:hypothetical protein